MLHLDVMDNHYVPNLTFGPMVCRALRDYGINAPIDVHLMATPVDPLIEEFAAAGANYISFHPEASQHVDRSLQLIHKLNCKAGLVLNPSTPLEVLNYVLDKLDMVLLMSVNPGFTGQPFIAGSYKKIRDTRKLLEQHDSHAKLAVDGGICLENIGAVTAAGADYLVAGKAIFASHDYSAQIAALRGAMNSTLNQNSST